jgi:hypothetical protein
MLDGITQSANDRLAMTDVYVGRPRAAPLDGDR